MRILIFITAMILLTGCGAWQRTVSSLTGDASEICMNRVTYYQFTSGSALAVDQKGEPITCD